MSTPSLSKNLTAHAIATRQEPKINASDTQHIRGAPKASLVPDHIRMQIAQQYHISPDIEDLYPASPI